MNQGLRGSNGYRDDQCNCMAVRDVLRMGDPRLLEVAEPVTNFDTPELHQLVEDLMEHLHILLE